MKCRVTPGLTWHSAFGLIGYGFDQLTPRYHPFSILDLTISYPFKADTVSNLNLELSCILAPALIIVIISLGLVPAPTIAKRFSTRALWGRKFWELGVGWLGLALAHTTQIMIITGLKSIIGKPRPDMLSRCNPDIANLEQHIVGGYGNAELPGLVLVSQTICQQPSKSLLDDGFRSFPSGHSSSKYCEIGFEP
jgi:membrane-associated phospholipid phosphatase